jgi:hypothetical protein
MNARLPLQVCVWIYCLSWAFDYRAAEGAGGSPVQYLFFAVTLASAAGVVALGFRRLFSLPMGWLTLGWGLYMISSFVVAVVNRVEMSWYFRNSIPPMLLLTSLCVTQIAASAGLGWKHVLWPMLIASVVNVFWRIFYALVVAGIPIELVRVELLSPCLPFLMGYLFAGLVLSRRVPWLAMICGAVGTFSYVLSITRSAVFILGAAGVGAVIGLWQSGSSRVLPPRFSNAKMMHASVLAGLLAAAVMVTAVGFPFVIERWTERLFYTAGGEQSSADPSALTRFAETKAFYDLLNKEPLTWVYGKGLGAGYYWDESFAVELAQFTYGNEDKFRGYTSDIRFPGHSIWTYAVFSGGVIGGLIYLAIFVVSTGLAYRSARYLQQVRDYPLDIAWLPFICLLAFLSQSLTFNPFIERAGGLVMGIVIGFPQFLFAAACRARRAAALRG